MARDIRGPYSRSDFLRLALAEFPILRGEFDEADGLLHLQMHAFTQLMQKAKGSADWETYRRGVRLAAELWSRPDADLLNALNVSFLEHLDFDGPRGPEAWKRLTSELQHGWKAMKAYNDRVAALLSAAKGSATQASLRHHLTNAASDPRSKDLRCLRIRFLFDSPALQLR